ncbi:MAG TPA: SWIM zinc finger family protein, partial [Pyrinomonadaceae bacterium]
MPPLDCIIEANLRQLAGATWFARGELYHEEDRVKDLTTDQASISARVVGNDTYRVRLSCRNNRIIHKCTCPVGEDGNFCKHCVAVGLAWVYRSADKPAATSSLQTFLENMDHRELVKLVLSEAAHNRRLRDNLEFEVACSVGPDLAVFKKIVTEATRTSGVDYYSMPRFADRLLEVINSIRGLLAGGHANAVVTLTEYAFTRLEKAIGQVDDSDGHFGNIVPALTEVHHEACVMAREDPLTLARRLFGFEMNNEWEFFHGAATIYQDVLGEAGLFEYQRLAEEAWSKVPPLK